MNFREVVNLVEAVAGAVNPGGHFLYGREYDATKDFKKKWPQIHLYPVKQSKRRGADHIVYTELLLCFFDQDKEGNTLEQRAEITYNMEDLARSFENTFKAQKVEFDGLNKEIQYRKFIADVTGVSMRLVFASPEGCEPIVELCKPAIITLNGESFLTVPSGAGKNIALVDQNDDQIEPQSVTGSKIKINRRVTINRTGPSVIATMEGPGDYTVADSVVTLVNTVGDNLGTTNIKADSVAQITAPPATIKLNGAPFIEVPSNKEADVLLKDPAGNTVTPQTVVGSQINLAYDVFFNLCNYQ